MNIIIHNLPTKTVRPQNGGINYSEFPNIYLLNPGFKPEFRQVFGTAGKTLLGTPHP